MLTQRHQNCIITIIRYIDFFI